ncbi:hypothetical protein B0H14DRAFT_2628426 [Mycena olivaceomarginata]|nr:hypothetical protein B0H14DRAFT_2628426 [Mycena olivaceomarginata]
MLVVVSLLFLQMVVLADWYFSGCAKGLSTEFEILAGADRRHYCGYACHQFSVKFDHLVYARLALNEGKGKSSNSALSPCTANEKYQPAYGNALAALVALRRQAGHEPNYFLPWQIDSIGQIYDRSPEAVSWYYEAFSPIGGGGQPENVVASSIFGRQILGDVLIGRTTPGNPTPTTMSALDVGKTLWHYMASGADPSHVHTRSEGVGKIIT